MRLALLLLFIPLFAHAGGQNHCGSKKVFLDTSDKVSGIPNVLCGVLRKVADKFGNVYIRSGFRPEADNKARGGANNSMHIPKNGGAYDFVVEGMTDLPSQRKLASFLAKQPSIRYNVYCTGRAHIDASKGRANGYDTCVK